VKNIMDIIRKFSIGSKNDDPEEEIAKLHRKLSTNTRRMSDASRKYQIVQQKQEELERKLVAAKQKKAEDDAFYAKQAKAIKRPEGEYRVWWEIPATSFSEMTGIIPDRGEEGEVMVRRTPTSGSDNPLLSASRSRSNSRSRRPPSTRSHRSSVTEAAEGAAQAVKSAVTDGYSSNKRGRPPAAGARYGHLFDSTIEPSTMTGATPLAPPRRRATSVGSEHCQKCGR